MSSGQFSLIRGFDQWQRASFTNASLVDGIAQLSWESQTSEDTVSPVASAAGLAFDAHCRLYRSLPETGNVERILWSAENPLHPKQSPESLALFDAGATPLAGDFSSTSQSFALQTPRALAIDDDQHLFIAETGARAISIHDLWSRRLIRRVSMPGDPVDLAADGEWIYVLLANPSGLLRLRAHGMPRRLDLSASIAQPSRLLQWHDKRLFVLEQAGTPTSRVVNARDGDVIVDSDVCAFASDIERYRPGKSDRDLLVIARRGGEDFIRVEIEGSVSVVAPLTSRAYDGRGIVRTPDQRIAYWTANGLRYAVAAKVRYERSGSVLSFCLDSGAYQTQWGRLFVDACIPRESSITVRSMITDELPEAEPLTRLPPDNVSSLDIAHDDLSPKMPAQWMVDAAEAAHTLYKRANGSELPWLMRRPDDDFAVYEAPIGATPFAEATKGRYLWILFDLGGNGNVTPRIRSVRAEYPGHDYLKRLPRTLSNESATGAFLQRYLALFAGQLGELSDRAQRRDVLLNPAAAPAQALPWLASFLGLQLDERWSIASRRVAIAEAIELFKRRGTIKGLSRFIEIVAGVRPIIIEKYRLRGGGMVGGDPARSSNAILGGGFRVGGAVGTANDSPLASTTDDAFATHAHRFTILLPGSLDEEELAMVDDLLDKHRPAHTLYDLCTIGAGMRVGRGLHIGLSSAIGRSGGFSQLQLGASALGKGAVLGRPQIGIRPGATRLPTAFAAHSDSRVG